MKKVLSVLLILAIVLAVGCAQPPPPPPPEPKAPPEPTPEQIAGEIRTHIATLQSAVQNNAPFPMDSVPAMAEGLRSAAAKHRLTDNGKAGIAQVSHDIEEVIRKARDIKRWKIVLGGIEAYDALVSGSSKYNRLKEQANLQLAKPSVKLKGFFTDHAANNEVYAFIMLLDPTVPGSDWQSLKVRVGEEFNNLKFLKIVGEEKGIELEYLRIPGDTFEVMK